MLHPHHAQALGLCSSGDFLRCGQDVLIVWRPADRAHGEAHRRPAHVLQERTKIKGKKGKTKIGLPTTYISGQPGSRHVRKERKRGIALEDCLAIRGSSARRGASPAGTHTVNINKKASG